MLTPIRHRNQGFSFWLVLLAIAFACEGRADRERVSFNDGWKFQHSDSDGMSGVLDYAHVRGWQIGEASGFFAPSRQAAPTRGLEPGVGVRQTLASYDDSMWRPVRLPHDWGVESPFLQELDGNTGKLPWAGIGWYRKHFTLPPAAAGRRISLEIDGAMSYASVWLNGRYVGGWPYGYSSFAVDLTPFAVAGDNVVAVRLDNPPESSRWYPGGGIYRNVWLVTTPAVHVAHWGVTVATPEIAADHAMVTVMTQIRNDSATPRRGKVRTRLFELGADGKRGQTVPGADLSSDASFPSGQEISLLQTFRVNSPKLWGIVTPQRYVAEVRVEEPDETPDTTETPFGIRSTRFDAARGFFLNGELVRIQGVCDHHDLGALGTAVNRRALQRQLEILRDMGCNAIRTSHNPPAPELLDLCDEMGFLVMDEAFDCWAKGKNRNDYHVLFPDWHEADLRALVRRDRNHPSVILWSIGNEVPEQSGPEAAEGWKLAAELAGIVREEDRTRAVSAAYNSTTSGYNGFQLVVDALGYNYKIQEYAKFRGVNPTIPLYGSETASCISSRGEYFFPVTNDKAGGAANFQMSSYDLYAPRWATTPDDEFRAADAVPGYAGEFVWTGFDYLGEPTPYGSDATTALNFSDPEARANALRELQEMKKIRVPSRSSYFGIVDLAGFPKDRYYLYQARWRPELPMAHLLPHWTWPERLGQVTPVHVYTSGDEAELFLNGQSLGRKKRGPGEYRLRWDDVIYQPGELRVVAYRRGQHWAEDTVRTAGSPAQIRLSVDRTALLSDGNDLGYVTAQVLDSAGNFVPRANLPITFSVAGEVEVAATDNGDATDHAAFSSLLRKTYNGLALAIIRPRAGVGGTGKIIAGAPGLPPAETTVTIAAGGRAAK